jgi:hypothetical protein
MADPEEVAASHRKASVQFVDQLLDQVSMLHRKAGSRSGVHGSIEGAQLKLATLDTHALPPLNQCIAPAAATKASEPPPSKQLTMPVPEEAAAAARTLSAEAKASVQFVDRLLDQLSMFQEGQGHAASMEGAQSQLATLDTQALPPLNQFMLGQSFPSPNQGVLPAKAAVAFVGQILDQSIQSMRKKHSQQLPPLIAQTPLSQSEQFVASVVAGVVQSIASTTAADATAAGPTQTEASRFVERVIAGVVQFIQLSSRAKECDAGAAAGAGIVPARPSQQKEAARLFIERIVAGVVQSVECSSGIKEHAAATSVSPGAAGSAVASSGRHPVSLTASTFRASLLENLTPPQTPPETPPEIPPLLDALEFFEHLLGEESIGPLFGHTNEKSSGTAAQLQPAMLDTQPLPPLDEYVLPPHALKALEPPFPSNRTTRKKKGKKDAAGARKREEMLATAGLVGTTADAYRADPAALERTWDTKRPSSSTAPHPSTRETVPKHFLHNYEPSPQLRKCFSRAKISLYKDMFRQFDRDNSGEVDEGELHFLLESIRRCNVRVDDASLAQLLADCDADGNRAFNFQEFLLLVHKLEGIFLPSSLSCLPSSLPSPFHNALPSIISLLPVLSGDDALSQLEANMKAIAHEDPSFTMASGRPKKGPLATLGNPDNGVPGPIYDIPLDTFKDKAAFSFPHIDRFPDEAATPGPGHYQNATNGQFVSATQHERRFGPKNSAEFSSSVPRTGKYLYHIFMMNISCWNI